MSEYANWGIIFQLIGVIVGAFGLSYVILPKKIYGRIFSDELTSSEINKLPKDNKGNPIFPIRINRVALSLSLILIIIGICFPLF